jgi:hypothetical protein
MNPHRELTIRALEQMKGDDTARARSAFRSCTLEQMGTEYGESGKTRAQILEEYEAHDAKVDAAIAWVKAV